MNGNKLFVDTNILLYLLNGDQTIADLLDQKEIYISVITEMELLCFSEISAKEETTIKNFIEQCNVVFIDSEIKNLTVSLKRKYKIKLPDSIIIATALNLDLPLVTADNDFKKVEELTLLHYEK